MGDLGFYFEMGWHHIVAWDALDHLLFVLALSAIYLIGNWKQVLVLVTAFTIGHSLTLALSVYDVIRVSDKWVEFLIPCTIVITAVLNLLEKDYEPRSLRLNYFLALFFGLIHGLGFANALRFMLAKDQGIGWSLFGFNIGLEAGQVVVVMGILLAGFLVVNKAGLKRKWWVWSLSVVAFSIAAKMAWERFPA
ncbi:MAG: HupE/UreJ family protein [Ferruginibacter sp.]|nr:HupE/UreJ family protein [Chitinophagaceae bacterium]MBP6285741.1 HupE/UreJ family protein [Ferruginibacter sp.]MBU9937118.1 HupE/UreJ family protein [Ferruginibacter sp.]